MLLVLFYSRALLCSQYVCYLWFLFKFHIKVIFSLASAKTWKYFCFLEVSKLWVINTIFKLLKWDILTWQRDNVIDTFENKNAIWL